MGKHFGQKSKFWSKIKNFGQKFLPAVGVTEDVIFGRSQAS